MARIFPLVSLCYTSWHDNITVIPVFNDLGKLKKIYKNTTSCIHKTGKGIRKLKKKIKNLTSFQIKEDNKNYNTVLETCQISTTETKKYNCSSVFIWI